MKHLEVLTDAGLIVRTKTGRTVVCQLTPAPMEQAMNWLARYERYSQRPAARSSVSSHRRRWSKR